MKKTITCSIASLLLLLLTAFVVIDHHIGKPYREFRTMEARYLTTQQGMTYEEVITIMGPPHRTLLNGGRYWDDTLLPEEQSALSVQSIRYSYPTFFVGVTLEFSFDSKNQLIGRHCYD